MRPRHLVDDFERAAPTSGVDPIPPDALCHPCSSAVRSNVPSGALGGPRAETRTWPLCSSPTVISRALMSGWAAANGQLTSRGHEVVFRVQRVLNELRLVVFGDDLLRPLEHCRVGVEVNRPHLAPPVRPPPAGSTCAGPFPAEREPTDAEGLAYLLCDLDGRLCGGTRPRDCFPDEFTVDVGELVPRIQERRNRILETQSVVTGKEVAIGRV